MLEEHKRRINALYIDDKVCVDRRLHHELELVAETIVLLSSLLYPTCGAMSRVQPYNSSIPSCRLDETFNDQIHNNTYSYL